MSRSIPKGRYICSPRCQPIVSTRLFQLSTDYTDLRRLFSKREKVKNRQNVKTGNGQSLLIAFTSPLPWSVLKIAVDRKSRHFTALHSGCCETCRPNNSRNGAQRNDGSPENPNPFLIRSNLLKSVSSVDIFS